MSFRSWVSVISLVAVVLLVVLAWKDIATAWSLLGQVQPLILLLVIPAQILSYYASGQIITSFLHAKGDLQKVSHAEITRFSLEFNFVNHILPTAGLSGASYATWRFKHMGVSAARSALANVLRMVMLFGAYLTLLIISVVALAIDGNINRLVLLFAGSLSTLIVVATLMLTYIASSSARSQAAGKQLGHFINKLIYRFVHKKHLIRDEKIQHFFEEMHVDYNHLRRSPHQLKAPFIWALVFLLLEIGLFMIVFAALGKFVNPAALMLAYGFAGLAGAFVVTPGGTGAYEAVMISFLASSGVGQGLAIAGVVLARVILIVLTIITGYIFYELTLRKYGKADKPKLRR